MRFTRTFAALTLGLASSVAMAADADQAIRKTLQAIQPDLPVEAIAESPMPGVYQVQLQGGRQLYASEDGQFLLQGYLFQVKDGKAVNLTEQAESQGVAETLAAIPASEMVIFAGKESKTHITVFTDTDCGYCQKLHSEVPELNRLGVEVRYLAFPRQGLGSAAASLADAAAAQFPLRVPRGFVARMRHGDPSDPLLRQVLPLDEPPLLVDERGPVRLRDPRLAEHDHRLGRWLQPVRSGNRGSREGGGQQGEQCGGQAARRHHGRPMSRCMEL